MTSETVFANASLILRDRVARGSLVVRDGLIADLDESGAAPAGAIDCGGDFIAPGMVELHTDNLERHIQPRPGVGWPHAAAIVAHDAELASVGITTVFDALRVGSIEEDEAEYPRYARPLASEILAMIATDALRISHYIHLRAEVCSQTLVAELDEFDAGDRVKLVSLMDHTPGQRQFRDITKLAKYVQGKSRMSDEAFAAHVRRLTDLQQRFGAQHEAAAVAVAQRLGAVLASHDDTTPEQVATSAGYGIRLAEFPTTVEAADACRDHGIATIMGAPNLVRGGSHSGNVAAAELARADRLDILSSDYVPSSLLAGAAILGGIWDDLPRAIATVTANPAEAAGLPDRGRIEPGRRADLIRFSMLDGTPVLRETWVGGRRVA